MEYIWRKLLPTVELYSFISESGEHTESEKRPPVAKYHKQDTQLR